MAKRRDPSISDIVTINSDRLTYEYIPNYMDKWDAVAYVKGHNGHYYIMKGWYRSYILRLYTKNQIQASDTISWDVDHDEILNDRAELTNLAMARFLEAVVKHHPYHHVPKVIDRQRRSCYRWEAEFGNATKTDGFCAQIAVGALVKKICDIEGVKPPMIKFRRSRTGTSWARMDTLVTFHTSSGLVSNKTIVHELAHIVDFARNRGKKHEEAGHGPSFIGIYIDMLVRHLGHDRHILEAVARKHKLKWTYAHAKEFA